VEPSQIFGALLSHCPDDHTLIDFSLFAVAISLDKPKPFAGRKRARLKITDDKPNPDAKASRLKVLKMLKVAVCELEAELDAVRKQAIIRIAVCALEAELLTVR